MYIYTAAQFREWDLYTIANEPISPLQLMERAAMQCTAWLTTSFDDNRAIKICCAKGNNGGDGLAIARLLTQQNRVVSVYILEFGVAGTPEFQANLQQLHEVTTHIFFIQDEQFFPPIDTTDIILDCMYGAGLNRPLTGLSASLVNHLNTSGATIVAIDLPGGMYADQSSKHNCIIKASHTLTFQTIKRCMLLPENAPYTGEVHVMDIGLHPRFELQATSEFKLTDSQLINDIYKPRPAFAHKGTFGHCLLVAGSKGKMGAAILTSKAALKSGAGMVTALVPPWGMPIVQSSFAEAMAIPADEVDTVEWNKYQAVGIGPGLGMGKEAVQLFKTILAKVSKPMVVDADALNILSHNPQWIQHIPADSVLTPHVKEFERLFGTVANDMERIELAVKKADELHLIIILKGKYSMVACPGNVAFFNNTGNAGMATAGSGDVLTGILTSLLAQGYRPQDAAVFGVYLHGLAGDAAADEKSKEAMVAGDIIKYIGAAFKKVQR